MKKSVWIFVVVMLLSLCMAAFSACSIGVDSGNKPNDSSTNSESYWESNISGDDKESESVSEKQTGSESDKTSESESGETSESESESESKSESGEESVHTHKFERNADERFLKSSATCEKRAEYYFSCKCGEIGMQTFEYGDLLPHTEAIDTEIKATCISAGLSAGKHCSVCNKVLEAQIAIPALGHDLAMHEGKASTCTEKGYAAYETCRRCDYTTYRELPLAEHELENGICKNCGKEITPHTHIEVIDEGKPATCLESGLTDGKHCSVCNKILEEQQVIPALGHDTISHDGKAATCTEAGYNAYETCSRCDYTTYIKIDALGHDIVSHAAKAATCTEAGYKAYETCLRCGYTTYREIHALGHNITYHDGKSATCTEVGYEAYETCSRCDYTTHTVISALGHNLTHYNGKAATCTKAGYEAYDECSRCGYTTYRKIDALGHNIVSHAAKSVTCTEPGYKAYEACSRCDYTTYEEIPALGHELFSYSGKDATCTESGFRDYVVCNRCSYTTYKELSPLGHKLECDYNPETNILIVSCARKAECGRKNTTMNVVKIEEVEGDCYSPKTIIYTGENGETARQEIGGTIHVLYGKRAPDKDENGNYIIYYVDNLKVFAFSNNPPSCDDGKIWFGTYCCEDCGKNIFIRVKLAHNFVGGVCARCGVSDGAAYSREGDYIYFGSYPQTKVSDETLINTLNTLAGALPTISNSYSWTSYGYYTSDYMWYIDKDVDGDKYRGVYFTSYRSNKGDNGYSKSTVYWFRYEGIRWRVLTESGNRAFLMCDMAIDAQQYDYDNGSYSNNYKESTIRKWLNKTFYNTAFIDSQKDIINKTSVDNSARSTNPYNNAIYWNNGENKYACENTLDKIFLLSEYEVTNSVYGFSNDTGDDYNRQLKSSDYAKSQGCYQDNNNENCSWWLRSSIYSTSYYVRGVDFSGNSNYYNYANDSIGGIVPALWITL